MTTFAVRAWLLAACCLPLAAPASPVLWDVTATLASGGTLTGEFAYDADLNLYSDVSLTISDTTVPSLTLTQWDVFNNTPNRITAFSSAAVGGHYWDLVLGYRDALTDAGGSTPVLAGSFYGPLGGSGNDSVVSGTVFTPAPVPAPPALPLLRVGAGALLTRRRQRR